MAVGFEYQGRCYGSVADAADSYFSSYGPVITSGTTSYVTVFSKDLGVWKSKGFSISSTGVWTQRFNTNAIIPTFPACDTAEQFNDGLIIGWGIAAAMIAAWAFNFMRQGLGVAKL